MIVSLAVVVSYCNMGLWTRDYSAKEYNPGDNVMASVQDYGLWSGSI